MREEHKTKCLCGVVYGDKCDVAFRARCVANYLHFCFLVIYILYIIIRNVLCAAKNGWRPKKNNLWFAVDIFVYISYCGKSHNVVDWEFLYTERTY